MSTVIVAEHLAATLADRVMLHGSNQIVVALGRGYRHAATAVSDGTVNVAHRSIDYPTAKAWYDAGLFAAEESVPGPGDSWNTSGYSFHRITPLGQQVAALAAPS